MKDPVPRSDFLDKKRDYSHLLVHLTREDSGVSAKEVLETILDEQTLRVYHYYCIFQKEISSLDEALQNKFKVVCFTETPIDQIEVLLERVEGRVFQPEPYGLVFKKDYIGEKGGNPVFYMPYHLSIPLWQIFNNAKENQFSLGENRLLALVNKCDNTIDFHWEREWRIVGDLEFKLEDLYCGLCEEDDIPYFEDNYKPVIFISPRWGIKRILDKLVKNRKRGESPLL